MFDTTLRHFQSVFANQFFVIAADEDYLFARWSRLNGFHRKFYWFAAQAIEKYLKATIVLNCGSAKDLKHDLLASYERHCEHLGSDSFLKFPNTPSAIAEVWLQQTPKEFLKRVNAFGGSDSRYRMTPFSTKVDDLHKLDASVFELRRRAIGLHWTVGEDWEEPDFQIFVGEEYRKIIRNSPSSQVRNLQAARRIRTDNSTSDSILNIANHFSGSNIACDDAYISRNISPRFGIENSYLNLLYQTLSEPKPLQPYGTNVHQCMNWLLCNVQVGGQYPDKFKQLLTMISRK